MSANEQAFLKTLENSLPHDNSVYNLRLIAELDSCPAWFEGKRKWRHAGKTEHFDKEKEKQLLKSWAEKISNLRVQQSNLTINQLATKVMRFIRENMDQPMDYKLMLTSTEYTYGMYRQNVLLMNTEIASGLQVLLSLFQNSLDLIISSYVDAVTKTSTSLPRRFYEWYHIMLRTSNQSLHQKVKITHPIDGKQQHLDHLRWMYEHSVDPPQLPSEAGSEMRSLDAVEDMVHASLYRLPLVFSVLGYDSDLLKRFTNAWLDYPDRLNSFSTILAPLVVPAACAMDNIFPMSSDPPFRVPACFDMNRIRMMKDILFERSAYAPSFFGQVSVPNPDDNSSLDEYSYRWVDNQFDAQAADLRMLDLQAWGAGELFHLIAPRQFLGAQVVVFVLALHASMWFFAVASKAKYSSLSSVQCALQWLHPMIGMSSSFCNHGLILSQYYPSVSLILYGKNTGTNDTEERWKQLEWLTTEMLQLLHGPSLSSSRSACSTNDEVKTRWDSYSQEEWTALLANAGAGFDLFLDAYQQILDDCKPWIEDYFSLPLLYKTTSLANPPLYEDSVCMSSRLQIGRSDVRQVLYQRSAPTKKEQKKNVALFWNSIRSFRDQDIQSFVDMDRHVL